MFSCFERKKTNWEAYRFILNDNYKFFQNNLLIMILNNLKWLVPEEMAGSQWDVYVY